MRSKRISVVGVIVIIISVLILSGVLRFVIRMLGGDKFNMFQKDFDDYTSAISKDFLNKKTSSINQLRDAQIYYSIASGNSITESTKPVPTGTISELGLDLKAGQLSGVEYYEITDDSNILGINGKKKFYDSDEKHYLTENGDVFILPGFYTNEDGVDKWYISANNYYENSSPIRDASPINVSNIKVTTDAQGLTDAGNNLKKGTKLFVSFSANLGSDEAIITPSVPFEVTQNGTYKFYISVSGRRIEKSVEVRNYRPYDIVDKVKVGDYISYIPDTNEYVTDKKMTGANSQKFSTEKLNWRVLEVNKEASTIKITTDGATNSGLFLAGTAGFAKGDEVLNDIAEKLYSNEELELKARCMNIEDANEVFEKSAPSGEIRYAYYPRGTSVSGTIEFEGNEYKKTVSEWRISRFYFSDGGGVEDVDENGLSYRSPAEDNPVFITQNFYDYKVDLGNSPVRQIIGKSDAWLASNAIYFSKSGVGFGIRVINNTGVTADVLYDSYANSYDSKYGFHPIVEIDDSYGLDISTSSIDGSSPEKAWRIVKF